MMFEKNIVQSGAKAFVTSLKFVIRLQAKSFLYNKTFC